MDNKKADAANRIKNGLILTLVAAASAAVVLYQASLAWPHFMGRVVTTCQGGEQVVLHRGKLHMRARYRDGDDGLTYRTELRPLEPGLAADEACARLRPAAP